MSAAVYVTVKQEVNYDLTLSTYIIRNAWRMQLAESRTTERRKKGQDSVKSRRQNTQGRCKKQRRREEQGYSSAANLDSQHPHQDRAWPARMAVTCILYAQQEMARLSGVCCDFNV